MSKQHYIVATLRRWNIAQFQTKICKFPGSWSLLTKPEQLTPEHIAAINPRYIFFPHWSYKVPTEITERFECVCFHETDVPYGRGGSPIQNLIQRGHKETVITALRMIEDFDAGPVYLKRPLSLEGLAEEIYVRAAVIISDIIKEIVLHEPEAAAQTGAVEIFKRRRPEQSAIPENLQSLNKLFDFIRMLDADDYPHAFLEYGDFRFELTRPALRTGQIEANVKISKRSNKEEK